MAHKRVTAADLKAYHKLGIYLQYKTAAGLGRHFASLDRQARSFSAEMSRWGKAMARKRWAK